MREARQRRAQDRRARLHLRSVSLTPARRRSAKTNPEKSIFLTAGIVFYMIMRKRRMAERIAEEKARQKYADLGFDDDEPQHKRGKKSSPPRAPMQPSRSNNRQSTGPGDSNNNYLSNPNMYLRNEGSSFQLSQMHPSLDGQQKPATQKEFV